MSLRSSVFSGQPSVENGQSPEENHVSSVSGSCTHPSPAACDADENFFAFVPNGDLMPEPDLA